VGGPDLTNVALHSRTRRVTARRRAIAREQTIVMSGQLAAGVGNLLYAVLMARLLTPAGFTDLAAFLVLYLLLNLPAAGLGASGALAAGGRLRLHALAFGAIAMVAIGTATPLLASTFHVPLSLPVLLAVAAPAAATLGLERGRLYAIGGHSRAAASLIAEPVVRLVIGAALTVTFGAAGAAAGIVVAGYAALLVTRHRAVALVDVGAHRSVATAFAGFVLLAVIQNQDLLLATHLLSPGQAARFAALSIIGGVAAFATATIPLVLLPRVGDDPDAFRLALLVTGAVGGIATLAFLVAPGPLLEAVFGGRYQSIAPLAAPYVLGMAALGVARVVVAHRVALHTRRRTLVLVGIAALVQLVLVLWFGSTPGAVAVVTIGTTMSLAAALGAATVIELPSVRSQVHRLGAVAWRPFLVVGGLVATAVALRVVAFRGLWVDEAISVSQAQMSFGRMLDHLMTTDVHPPLHAAVLWLSVRVVGTGELAVRSPSLIAGVLLIPVLYVAGRDLFDRRTGMLAAAIGAVCPIAVWYSQEARMYSLYMLFALAAVWSQSRALTRGAKRDWVLYAVSTAALLWTQYLSVLLVAAQHLLFVEALWQRRRRREPIARTVLWWIGALTLVAVLMVPILPFLGEQLSSHAARGAGSSLPSQAGAGASEASAGLSVYSILANLLWAVGGYHADATMARLAAFWPLGMLAVLLVLGRRQAPEMSRLLVVAVIPLLALFAIGMRRPDLFELRYVAGLVPLLLLIGARSVTALTDTRPWAAAVACCLVVGLSVGALADQQLNGTNPRLYDFRGALREVRARAGRGDVLLYNPLYLREVVEYYVPHVRASSLDGRGRLPRDGHVFLVGSFFEKKDISGRTGTVLSKLEHRRRLVRTIRRPQVRVWEFA
jgi:O-antigen/teichoic acid export membrane protein